MAGVFNYRLKEKYPSCTCVVKYWFGKKYFIWKALHLKQGCEQVFRDLNNKIARYKFGTLPDDDQFFKVAQYCSKYPATLAIVEVLCESNDLCKLIEFDKQQLMASASDPDCLNLSDKQYLPGWLKCVTSNKALQSIISVPDDTIHTEEPKHEPGATVLSIEPNLNSSDTPTFSNADILSRLRSLKQ